MPLKHRNQFQKIADRNNEPPELQRGKDLKTKGFLQADARDLGRA